ncbi:hypothetical protein DFP72DRAFT_517889 [Ephemerocybe angulata]|uniref:Uncharacterized protein n=1 Tax=Ephemerocybe angulata TaxID=980116 RepID=A0A8H6LZQ3_9AGAR|nr:hypothetical protein DFP72DRAFT_517889 [Tulosesus angulatus]
MVLDCCKRPASYRSIRSVECRIPGRNLITPARIRASGRGSWFVSWSPPTHIHPKELCVDRTIRLLLSLSSKPFNPHSPSSLSITSTMVYISRSTLAAAAVIAFIAPALAVPVKKTRAPAAKPNQAAVKQNQAAQNPPPRGARQGPSTSKKVVSGLKVANEHLMPFLGSAASIYATATGGAPPAPVEAPGPMEAPMGKRDYKAFGRRNIDPVELDFESREYEEEMEAREVEDILDLFRRAFDLDETD